MIVPTPSRRRTLRFPGPLDRAAGLLFLLVPVAVSAAALSPGAATPPAESHTALPADASRPLVHLLVTGSTIGYTAPCG